VGFKNKNVGGANVSGSLSSWGQDKKGEKRKEALILGFWGDYRLDSCM